ncbi:hypothetical protein B4916_22420 [Yersinia intermedia]|nr:hypothetical protein B4916_22420 [Yersinia intermedia]
MPREGDVAEALTWTLKIRERKDVRSRVYDKIRGVIMLLWIFTVRISKRIYAPSTEGMPDANIFGDHRRTFII